MSTMASDGFAFVIDTEQYAGNFERETCAAVTGIVGECEVGKEAAAAARTALSKTKDGKRYLAWCEEHVSQVPDEHGCHRPCSIYPTPGWFNDGHGNEYRATDAGSAAVIEAYEATVRETYEDDAKRADERAAEEKENGNAKEEKAWRREAAGHRKSIADAVKRGPGRFPSYQSVAIWLDAKPPAWVVAVMKARAQLSLSTPGKWRGAVAVTGFRLVEIVTTTKEEAL